MNRLYTGESGGMPISQSTFDFVEESIKSLTSVVVKSIANAEFAKLTGCVVSVANSGGTEPLLNVTEGAIWVVDEIYFVPAITNQALPEGTTLQNVLDNYKFDLVETFDTVIVYKNGSSYPAYKYRTATVLETPIEWVSPLVSVSIPSISDSLTNKASTTSYGIVKLENPTDIALPTSLNALTSSALTNSVQTVTIGSTTDTEITSVGVRDSYIRKLTVGGLTFISGEIYLKQLVEGDIMRFTAQSLLPTNDILNANYIIVDSNGSFEFSQIIETTPTPALVVTHPYLHCASIYNPTDNEVTITFFDSKSGLAKPVKVGTLVTISLNKIYLQ